MAAGAGGSRAIAVDCAVETPGWPPEEVLQQIAERAIAAAAARIGRTGDETLTILFTDDAEMRALNARFRGKDKPTNVLSFPAIGGTAPPGTPRHLGDIALGYEKVTGEARAEGKLLEHHLAHLVVHGYLHLLGYDHEMPEEAEEMEQLEREILESLAIGDPYA
ncbi:rRNA maturation RNase YbeY [Chelativorans sp. AA-79]|uniref:rRNA maturation RNase YbeY n=1 Tax=Chelativorans sp. AA-79 TaxID=3028735 RepID=UPI0023F6AF62|nr:rRNA maturation RNase YbeY [Chelativorans sp. AA-79]WEX09255.1 rRNA maturation RNase YbeY [Chelativorans sp. AA-79]